MGLLDDAIREHLELKRRHGADPDEVARQEQEALGAAARASAEATAEPADGAVASAADDDVAAVEAPTRIQEPGEAVVEDAIPEDAIPDAPTQEHDVPADETIVPESPERAAADVAAYEEEPWLEEDEPEEEAAAAEDGEDVLEETPEFLQETPEHDRLWFEQRPPRDFDWDK